MTSGVLVWLVLAIAFVGLGASLRDAALVTVGLVIQWVSGVVLWMAARRGSASLNETLGVGLVLGTVLASLSGIAGNLIFGWDWWWLLPALVATAIGWKRREYLSLLRESSDLAAWWPVAVGLLVGIGLLWLNLRRYPLSWQGVWDGYHPDMVFFEALSYSVANFGSSDSIFMVGGDIRYHWLTYAWSGQLSTAFDAAPFMVLTRVLPVVALFGLVLLAVALVDLVARHQSDRLRMWARWIAVALVVPGGYLGAVNGTILNFDSPSQALTSAWVLAWMAILLIVVTEQHTSTWSWAALGCTAFAVTGGKVSSGAVIGVSVAVAAVVGIITRRPWWRQVLMAAVITGVAVGLAGLFFAWGSASPGDLRFLVWEGRASTIQGLNSSTGSRGVVLGTAGLLVAMTARWAGGIFLLADRSWRERIEPWLGVGFVLAGALPVIFFAQGVNETWFALTASAPLAVLSAVGVTVGWQRAGLGRRAALAAVLAGIAGFVAVSYVWTDQVWESGFGRFWGPWLGVAIAAGCGVLVALVRRHQIVMAFFAVAVLVLTVEAALGRGTPIVAAAVGGARDGASIRASELADPGLVGTSEAAVAQIDPGTGEQEDDDVQPDDTVKSEPVSAGTRPLHAWSSDHVDASNLLRREARTDDVIITNEVDAFLVPALTRRRTFISGAPYQALYGSTAAADLIPERLSTNGTFLESADPASVQAMCDVDARWVWLAADRSPDVDPEALGSVVLANDSVTVIRLNSTSCPR